MLFRQEDYNGKKQEIRLKKVNIIRGGHQLNYVTEQFVNGEHMASWYGETLQELVDRYARVREYQNFSEEEKKEHHRKNGTTYNVSCI